MRVIEILEHHQACVDTFLSKKVTHIITTPKCFSKNDIIAKNATQSCTENGANYNPITTEEYCTLTTSVPT